MNHTYLEIRNQPTSWERTITSALQAWEAFGKNLKRSPITQFLFMGCGTSYYLAQSVAALFQELTGHVSRGIPASEVFLASESCISKELPTIAFVISRSGTTSEGVLAAEYLKKNYPNIPVIAVTCNSEGTLANTCHYTISLNHVVEKSVVMTQSFTNMILALQVFAAKFANSEEKIRELQTLPEICKRNAEKFEEFGKNIGTSSEHTSYIFLGLGKYYGLAEEANLKLKEMTQTTCEAYNPLEFRHGPISIVTNDFCVILIQGEEGAQYIDDVGRDVKNYGAYVVTIHPAEVRSLTRSASVDLELEGDLSDWARTILYMPPLQFLAYHRAISLGLNPDKPRNLTQVVKLSK